MASSSKGRQDKASDVSSARNKLDGVLQNLMVKAEESTESSSDDSSTKNDNSYAHRATVPTKRQYISRVPRKKRRKDITRGKDSNNSPVSFVMKLFDRSVDLAKFNENVALYPVCRAWIFNEPNNDNPVKDEPLEADTSKTEITIDDNEEDAVKDVYHLPAPLKLPKREGSCVIGSRIPAPLPSTEPALDINAAPENQPSTENLLSNHMTRWKNIRQSWKEAGFMNEARYKDSLSILRSLKVIYE